MIRQGSCIDPIVALSGHGGGKLLLESTSDSGQTTCAG